MRVIHDIGSAPVARRKLTDPLRERIKELRKEAESIQPKKAQPPYHFDDSHYSDAECLQMAEEIFSRWLDILCRDPRCLTNLDTKDDIDRTWREFSRAMAY
jgi:hypothetical protein